MSAIALHIPPSSYRVYYRTDLWPQSIAFYVEMVQRSTKQYPALIKPNDVMAFRGDEFWWMRKTQPLRDALDEWVQQWITTPHVYEQYRDERRTAFRNAQSTLGPLQLPLLLNENTSDTILAEYYEKIITTASDYIGLVEYTVDAFDDHFHSLLFDWVNKNTARPIAPEDRGAFIASTPLTGIGMERKTILEYALKTLPLQLLPKDIAHEYSWIRMGWNGEGELTEEEVKKEIRAAKRKGEIQMKTELATITNHAQEICNQRVAVKQKYGLPDEPLESYWNILNDHAMFHDQRKEIQMRTVHCIFRILHILSQHINVQYRDLLWYTAPEILTLIHHHTPLTTQKLNERKAGLVYEIHNEKFSTYCGSIANDIINTHILPRLHGKTTNHVQGLSATNGEVTANVFITNNATDANKNLQAGNILITNSTGVEFLPAMQRAAGIITDDGGITSHAAVVSREMHIPCIVGTKNATRSFVTGDTVYLNATKGYAKRVS